MKDKIDIDDFFEEKLGTINSPNLSEDWAAMEQMLEEDKGVPFWLRNKYAIILISLLFFGMVGVVMYPEEQSNNRIKRNQIVSENQLNEVSENQVESIATVKETTENIQVEKLDEDVALSSSTTGNQINKVSSRSDKNLDLDEPNSPNKLDVGPDIQTLPEQGRNTIETTILLVNDKPSKTVASENMELSKLSEAIAPLNRLGIESLIDNEYSEYSFSKITSNIPKSKLSFGIDVYGTYNVYQRTKNGSNNFDQEKEVNSVGYGLGGFANYKRWKLKIGVEQLNLSEQNNYIAEEIVNTYDTSFVLVKRNYDVTEHGRPRALVKEVYKLGKPDTSYNEICPDCKTTFSYIHVPIGFQYELGKSRIRYFGEVGMGLMFLQKTNGNYSTKWLEDLSKENGGNYVISPVQNDDLTKLLTSARASLGIRYRLTSDFSLYSSYGMSFYGKSMLIDYKQIPSVSTFKLGVEYGF